MAVYIHWTVCKHMGLQVTDRYYARVPGRVVSVNGATVVWDVPFIKVRKILANRHDIMLHGKKERPCLLIDIDIYQMTQKLTQKKLKN